MDLSTQVLLGVIVIVVLAIEALRKLAIALIVIVLVFLIGWNWPKAEAVGYQTLPSITQ